MTIKIGDRVRTSVFVSGERRMGSLGIVVAQSSDGTVSQVDIGKPHGAAPWIVFEDTSHLVAEPL